MINIFKMINGIVPLDNFVSNDRRHRNMERVKEKLVEEYSNKRDTKLIDIDENDSPQIYSYAAEIERKKSGIQVKHTILGDSSDIIKEFDLFLCSSTNSLTLSYTANDQIREALVNVFEYSDKMFFVESSYVFT